MASLGACLHSRYLLKPCQNGWYDIMSVSFFAFFLFCVTFILFFIAKKKKNAIFADDKQYVGKTIRKSCWFWSRFASFSQNNQKE